MSTIRTSLEDYIVVCRPRIFGGQLEYPIICACYLLVKFIISLSQTMCIFAGSC